jgi:hypothetical protein
MVIHGSMCYIYIMHLRLLMCYHSNFIRDEFLTCGMCMLRKLKNEGFVIQDFKKVLFGIPVYHFVNRLQWATDDKIHYCLCGGRGRGLKKTCSSGSGRPIHFLSTSRLIVMLKLINKIL